MKESNTTYYECEFCGKTSQNYDEIEECEKICKSIHKELSKFMESLMKLNELGCTIELREYPYYEHNKVDLAVAKRLQKYYKLVFPENDKITFIPCSVATSGYATTTLHNNKEETK